MESMWPKREYFIQLSAMYGQEGDEGRQLALFETAYEAGWLLRSSEIVNLSQLLLQADIPYKAAKILEKGLEDGIVESTESNWRVLAQAWQLAQEDEEAIPALSRAAGLADDGVLDVLDVVTIIDIILNSNYHEISDLNEDQIINIQDVVLLLNLILNN